MNGRRRVTRLPFQRDARDAPTEESCRAAKAPCTDVRLGMTSACLAQSILDNLQYVQARTPQLATRNDWYLATAFSIRDRLLHRWIETIHTLVAEDVRVVSYLSAEFLLGPHLGNNLVNLGIQDEVRQALRCHGLDLDDLLSQEEEPGLGNGGLGRLAACYLDSLATLGIPAVGYGLRYEFGIFDQEIRDGWQVEIADSWLRHGNPWEISRPEITFTIPFGGRTEPYCDQSGRYCVRWLPDRAVCGVAHDTPISGYRVNTVNVLRLWRAQAVESFEFQAFNVGDYYGAVEEKVVSENLTKVLYPNDELVQGKQLRLEQQYFFVSCSLRDMIRIHLAAGRPIDTFHEKFVVQLNDTHPAIGIAELMRLLVDDYAMDWEKAWSITARTFAYTNHTLLPEALEKWPVPLMAAVLPRHLEIIYEINRRFLDAVQAEYPGDEGRVARMSLIDESAPKYVRMAHLASVGSQTINGVAALHTELLKADVLQDFHTLWPEKFCNITNGVTLRRWMLLSNPRLAQLISSRIGTDWIRQPEEELRRLEPLADDAEFVGDWHEVKRQNGAALTTLIHARTGIEVDPDSLFDIHVKRLHEYKRQHLNVLHIITAYLRLKHDPHAAVVPRTFVFGGKAAPAYAMAKLMIKLIHCVGEVVNHDPDVAGRLKVVFLPDFNVTYATARLPGRGPFRADLDGRQGGVWHGEHEVRPERGVDDRHARRSKRRNPPAGGERELFPLWADRSRGARSASSRL